MSDLHYERGNDTNIKNEIIDKTLTDTLELLESALKNTFINEKRIDIIVFCGDYIFGPNKNEDKEKAFNLFLEFLERITKKEFGIFNDNSSEHILIVPGNHDIIRQISGDCLKRFKERTQNYCTPFSECLSKYAPVYIFNNLKLIFACESTVNNSDTVDPEVAELIPLVKNISEEDAEIKDKIFEYLNSHISYDIPSIEAEAKNIFIERSNVIKNEIKNVDNYLKIMLTHHPLLSGAERFINVKEYDKTVGGYEFMRTAIDHGYELFIHGHLHEESCLQIRDYADCLFKRPIIQLGIPKLGTGDDSGIILIETKESLDYEIIHLELNKYQRELLPKKLIYSKSNETNLFSVSNEEHILVDYEIEDLINEGKIIKGGNLNYIEAASYDCALGYEYKRQTMNEANSTYTWPTESLKIQKTGPAKIELKPKETILIYTREEFDLPENILFHASPISSWLRKGISVDLSYFVDPGFKGQFCFPITNRSNINVTISSNEPIMSIEIIKLSHKCQKTWVQRHPDKVKTREGYQDK